VGGHLNIRSIVPLYIDFKAKRCHQCFKPIINYRKGLFCCNMFMAMKNPEIACYKFICRECLGDKWTL
jgi:hypothetical protein